MTTELRPKLDELTRLLAAPDFRHAFADLAALTLSGTNEALMPAFEGPGENLGGQIWSKALELSELGERLAGLAEQLGARCAEANDYAQDRPDLPRAPTATIEAGPAEARAAASTRRFHG